MSESLYATCKFARNLTDQDQKLQGQLGVEVKVLGVHSIWSYAHATYLVRPIDKQANGPPAEVYECTNFRDSISQQTLQVALDEYTLANPNPKNLKVHTLKHGVSSQIAETIPITANRSVGEGCAGYSCANHPSRSSP